MRRRDVTVGPVAGPTGGIGGDIARDNCNDIACDTRDNITCDTCGDITCDTCDNIA